MYQAEKRKTNVIYAYDILPLTMQMTLAFIIKIFPPDSINSTEYKCYFWPSNILSVIPQISPRRETGNGT